VVKAQVGPLTISCIAKVAKRSVRRGTIHAARMSHRKGALILSMTKKFGSDEEAEFNLGKAGQAFPSDLCCVAENHPRGQDSLPAERV